MDYEKAYKEALERANSFQEKYGGDYAGYIFPELRESEDERIRKRLLWFLANYTGRWDYPETRMACRAWLKKQKEQKPAEWSEEDEDMLNSCISSIEEAKENRYAYKETDGDTSYDHEIAWLKLLRNRVGKEFLQPHWKPSDEQIRPLEYAIEYFKKKKNDVTYLESLCEDLKKLM